MNNNVGVLLRNGLRYTGLAVSVTNVVSRSREPTGQDFRQPETGKLYPLNAFWLVGENPTTGLYGDIWVLSKIVSNVAYWVRLSAGGSGNIVEFQPNSGTNPVVADPAGLVNVYGTGSTTTVGSLNTLTVQLTGLTQYSIQSGGASSSQLNNIAPSATSGIPLVSQGSAAQPIFGTAVVAGGGTGQTTLTANSILVGNGTNPITQIVNGTTGQILTAVTGGNPIWATPSDISTIVIQTFTNSGTYTPTSGMKYCIVEVVGGGGGGGGTTTTGAGEVSAGGGGGGGGYARGVLSAATIGVSKAVTVGAGGTAGTAAGGTGGTGGTSSLTTLVTATGGNGGAGGAAYSNFIQATGGGNGGSGGGTNSSLNIDGSWGTDPFGFVGATYSYSTSGNGGASFFGGATRGTTQGGTGTSNAAIAGKAYGGGGSGSGIGSSSTGVVGGAGGAGVVIITEFI